MNYNVHSSVDCNRLATNVLIGKLRIHDGVSVYR